MALVEKLDSERVLGMIFDREDDPSGMSSDGKSVVDRQLENESQELR